MEGLLCFAGIMVDAFAEDLLFPRSCSVVFPSIIPNISSFTPLKQGLHSFHLTNVEMEVPQAKQLVQRVTNSGGAHVPNQFRQLSPGSEE